MLIGLLLVPSGLGLLAFFLRNKLALRLILLLGALVHFGLVVSLWVYPTPEVLLGGWVERDALGTLFLSITSLLFLCAALFGQGYLGGETRLFPPSHQAVFVGCLLMFLSTMTLACLSQHLGLLWVAIEATTLASAPMIYFHRSSRSLEATWKYLVICSVGIALALLGNFLLGLAASVGGGASQSLVMKDLLATGAQLSAPWLKVAFVFFLVGYGTKMGLAPMHTWLPDAHSEAPSMVSALLSGALLNNAFLGILRMRQVCLAAGLGSFGQGALLALGLISMAVAAVFIVRQTDYKRLLAYSSVEHMGIMAIGIGLGGPGIFAALFHAVNHSLTKGMLFLTAGNILEAYHTKSIHEIRGLQRQMPWTGFLWVAGFLAITGTPPFSVFLSEFLVAKAAFADGRYLIGAFFLGFLALIFVGMAGPFLEMAQGEAPKTTKGREPREVWIQILPAVFLLTCVSGLGVYLPPWLEALLRQASALLGG